MPRPIRYFPQGPQYKELSLNKSDADAAYNVLLAQNPEMNFLRNWISANLKSAVSDDQKKKKLAQIQRTYFLFHSDLQNIFIQCLKSPSNIDLNFMNLVEHESCISFTLSRSVRGEHSFR